MEETARNFEGAGDGAIMKLPVNEQNTFVRILRNDLVTDKILFFLTFQDIKALSTVSLQCLGAVRNSKEFGKRARFIISKESVASQVSQKRCYQWSHFSVDFHNIPDLDFDLIADLMQSTKSVSLWLSEGRAPDSLQLKRYLSKILRITAAVVLECLEMDFSLIKTDLSTLFSNSTVQKMLTDLKVLVIESKVPNQILYIDDLEHLEDSAFQRNFRQLAEIPLKLKKFVFGKQTNHDADFHNVKFIPKIVNAAKDTLEELELHHHNIWVWYEMKGICCPKLKRLVLSAHGNNVWRDDEIFEGFIMNQPPLEVLVIEIYSGLPVSTVQKLKERVSKMKKLHIQAKYIDCKTPVNWSFLETMTELKDFRIEKPNPCVSIYPDKYGSGEAILAKLPSGMEKISLQGFQSFWKEPSVPLLQPSPQRNIGDLLSRFVNLTEICLVRSGSSAITNEGLQSVILNCKKLTSLVFSCSERLTDFAISGVKKSEEGTSQEKVGVSLMDLKGLVNFGMYDCPNVSTECLLKQVEFHFLRYFYYSGKVRDPKAFLAQIVRQNRCLETVALRKTKKNFGDTQYLDEIRDEMAAINPRVRVIDIPPPTWQWQRYDSDSDADSDESDL